MSKEGFEKYENASERDMLMFLCNKIDKLYTSVSKY